MLNRNPQNNLIVRTAFTLPLTTSMANFESIAMPHLNDLYRTALHLLQQPAQASAAVEETFVRARVAFGEHPRGTNFRTRVFQILIQIVRLTRVKSMGVGIFKGEHRSSSYVVSAINRIPIDFRLALLLIDGQRFSYNDAARILGLSEEIVAHHIIQGRNHLQSELETSHSTPAVTQADR